MKSVVNEIVVINIVTCTVYTYTSICSHTVTHERTLAHTFTYMNTHMHTHTHTHARMQTRAYTHTHAHMHVHAHKYNELVYLLMYTHTNTLMPQALLASLLLPYQTLASRSCTLDDSSSSFGVKLPYSLNDDKEREVYVLWVIPSVVQGLDGEHTVFCTEL